MTVFRLTMFPAGDGDCLLLSYGESEAKGALRHILVDGGRKAAYQGLKPRLQQIADAGETVELLVLTHIDADHIEGLLAMGADAGLPIVPKQVWYNGYDQMARLQAFGPKQGDEYSAQLTALQWPLNTLFGGDPISIEARREPFEFAGLRITLLSPDAAHLATMRERWANWRTLEAAKEAAKALARAGGPGLQVMGRKPMPAVLDVETLAKPTTIDPEPPNGSSIAFMAEWKTKRVLLAGDAHPDLLAATLEAFAEAEGGRCRIDLFKVSHHGSHGNTTRELVERLDCRRFALSTDGTRHGHPDPEAIARLLAYAPPGEKTLYFNYRTKRTEPWDDDAALKARHAYRCVYPASIGEPVAIDV
jgi:beta-lactamase superfamily II metal-dependent hydrolase